MQNERMGKQGWETGIGFMKCKVARTQNGFSIEVPSEAGLAEGEAELFESVSGACIIVAQK
ncbi:Uncharacterised protein [Candidatus Anstonella stagnisolia]|nr:Uncharacterised protein [Candidatus Anstonella stagnisolia]